MLLSKKTTGLFGQFFCFPADGKGYLDIIFIFVKNTVKQSFASNEVMKGWR